MTNITTQDGVHPAFATEDPLDADFPVCDPHHHLWDHPGQRYLLDDFLQDAAGGHRVVQSVFVECNWMYRKGGPQEMRPVGETEFARSVADQTAGRRPGTTAVAAGIVGFADLTLGAAVAPVLEAHILAGGNRFRGIRHTAVWHASPDIPKSSKNPPRGLLMDVKFREGFARLREYNLTFDAWIHHTQLMELADLARTFPDIPVVLDHTGGPLGIGPYAGKREEVYQEWKRGIAALAACQNAAVKLGGLGMPRFGFGWHERASPRGSAELADAMSPYFLWCIEQFGAARCMFESNFPVDKVSYSYTVLWNAFKRICRNFSPRERASLLHDTAARFYRLRLGG